MSAAWLDSALSGARIAIVKWVLDNVIVEEMPTGSNRSALIDAWNTAAAAPLGSPWCASFARAAWLVGGITPLGNAACEDWHQNAVRAGRFTTTAQPGDVALFDLTGGGIADHCGIVTRLTPHLWTMEGNTNSDGSREGYAVMPHARLGVGLIGYVSVTWPFLR